MYTQLSIQGLEPAKADHLATRSPVALPFGGPTGVGGAYGQGAALGLIGGAAANAVLTLTLTKNSATGLKGYFTYYSGEKVYSGLAATGGITANASSAFPSAAQVQAALVATVPQWNGNLTVTGSDTANYTLTFNNRMGGKRYGGLLTFTVTAYTAGTGPTGAITVATAGSAGAGQFDLYANGGTPNRVDAFLQYPITLDPAGTPVGLEFPGSGQAASGYPAWTKGIFYADQTNFPEKSVLTGSGNGLLDSSAIATSGGKLVFHNGTALTDTGVMIDLR